MTNEEKQLLLKDLCARLPYTPQVVYNGITETLSTLHIFDMTHIKEEYVDIKPYLRPMSSMTKEEEMEYDELCYNCQEQDRVDYNIRVLDRTQLIYVIDWLNAHHFDYRGLIPMGLALEAKEGMYNFK